MCWKVDAAPPYCHRMRKELIRLAKKVEKVLERKSGDPMDLYLAASALRDACNPDDHEALALALRGHAAGAERGEANACHAAGLMTLNGEGTEADPDRALAFFAKGSEAGNWGAAIAAAKLHYVHTRDYAAARRHAAEATHPGSPEAGAAHYLLGLLDYHGLGGPKDARAAFAHHKKAAALEDVDAMFELYVLLSTGDGVAKDEKQALRWCKKAAEAGQPRACYNMGAFHATGNGVKKDEAKAIDWYERAAWAGHGRAAGTLAAMAVMKGEEGLDEAIRWISRARSLSFDVCELFDELGVPEEVTAKLVALAQESSR